MSVLALSDATSLLTAITIAKNSLLTASTIAENLAINEIADPVQRNTVATYLAKTIACLEDGVANLTTIACLEDGVANLKTDQTQPRDAMARIESLLSHCKSKPRDTTLRSFLRPLFIALQQALLDTIFVYNSRTTVANLFGCIKKSNPQIFIKNGDSEKLRALLEADRENVSVVEYFYLSTWTPLMCASYHGNADAVRLLLAAGAEVDLALGGYTALMHASNHNHVVVIQMLLDAGASVGKVPESFSSPLDCAINCNQAEAARLLLNAGADACEHELLANAALTASYEVIQLLVEAGADVNSAADDGRTALMGASEGHNTVVVVAFLLDAGADASMADNKGRTALMKAEECHYDDVAALLRWKLFVTS
jgi:ankyrin repeat protein